MKALWILMLGLAWQAAGEAAPRPVIVLYDGNTPVNADVIHFLQDQFAQAKAEFSLRAVGVPAEVSPDQIVLVLNTGLVKGIDRKLADEVARIPDKSNVLLITIERGSDSLTFKTLPPSPATLGLDAVTAASRWEGRGFGALFGGQPSANWAMHRRWTLQVLDWIQQRRGPR
jgi:hypothetical protein